MIELRVSAKLGQRRMADDAAVHAVGFADRASGSRRDSGSSGTAPRAGAPSSRNVQQMPRLIDDDADVDIDDRRPARRARCRSRSASTFGLKRS